MSISLAGPASKTLKKMVFFKKVIVAGLVPKFSTFNNKYFFDTFLDVFQLPIILMVFKPEFQIYDIGQIYTFPKPA